MGTQFTFKWVSSAGGPLLLLPERLLPAWGGIHPPTDGRRIETAFRWNPSGEPCDYDRACDLNANLREHMMLPIDVGDGYGLVLDNENVAAAWLPADEGVGGMIVSWFTGSDESHLLACAKAAPATAFGAQPLAFEVPASTLLLFDSGVPGTDFDRGEDDHLEIPLAPGHYLIRAAVLYKRDEQTALILHRFSPV